MTETNSLPPAYFEALYTQKADPWGFESSAYEKAKYDDTLAALPAPVFSDIFEVGCSIGVLTHRLAARCAALLAVDVSETALARARKRCSDLAHVEIRHMHVPMQWPSRLFDLILLSEVLYYLSPGDIVTLAHRARGGLQPGGYVLLVHYILPTDYPCGGDQACEIFMEHAGLSLLTQKRTEQYRLDLLRI